MPVLIDHISGTQNNGDILTIERQMYGVHSSGGGGETTH